MGDSTFLRPCGKKDNAEEAILLTLLRTFATNLEHPLRCVNAFLGQALYKIR